MIWLRALARWLNVRPEEARTVGLSFVGAFLVIAFLVLARSLREALYLTSFPVETLPYITGAVAVLSIPAVGLFTRTLARFHPKQVLASLVLIVCGGLLALWPVATRVDAAVVAFYLWTALGTLLLTSGFWIVTSEHFAVRGAKRSFGLIGAGGTAGAMVMGNALPWLTGRVDLSWLIPGLIVLLLLLLSVQALLPRAAEVGSAVDRGPDARDRSSMAEGLSLVWRTPHLRTIALIVLTATVATTLLDYQFKELARAEFPTTGSLTGFFGAFYGWTGLASLLIQLLLASRIMAGAGIAATLAILPLLLLLGSAGLLIVPSLVLVTLVRGADNAVRKSLYRSVLEVLYVPIPSLLRRKTKTFIDSAVDSVGEGLGAAIVFLWVTLPGFPSRYLSVYIGILSIVLLALSRRMGRRYFATVTERLREGGARAKRLAGELRPRGRDLISGTFTRMDLSSVLDGEVQEEGEEGEDGAEGADAPSEAVDGDGEAGRPSSPEEVIEALGSMDHARVARTLEQVDDWREEYVPALCRLLARDPLYERAAAILVEIGDASVPELVRALRDEGTDFVIRRRIPRILAGIGGPEADDALLDALTANRFEVRYRAARALRRRRRLGLPTSRREVESRVWAAVRVEVSRERPVWELQRLLDRPAIEEDDLVTRRVGIRGELSLEHTFRLLTLVLDPEPVRAAYHGVILDDEKLNSFALEYLEQVLPDDVRDRLWPFIGDVTERQRRKALRPLDQVVSDLITTGATLFGDETEQAALKRMLEEREE